MVRAVYLAAREYLQKVTVNPVLGLTGLEDQECNIAFIFLWRFCFDILSYIVSLRKLGFWSGGWELEKRISLHLHFITCLRWIILSNLIKITL